MRKPLYPLGRDYETAKFQWKQNRTPEPPITDAVLEKATNAACARYVGGISGYRFQQRLRELAQEFGFSCAENLMGALSHTHGATWPFTDYIPAEWQDSAAEPEKPLPGGMVIR